MNVTKPDNAEQEADIRAVGSEGAAAGMKFIREIAYVTEGMVHYFNLKHTIQTTFSCTENCIHNLEQGHENQIWTLSKFNSALSIAN